MKVVLNLWDGVRFDAIFKVHQWMGLPNLHRVINNGVLFTNLYTQLPALTPVAVGRIMHNKYGKPLSQSLWEKMRKSSCYVGYPEDENRKHFPHCNLLDVLYDRKAEAAYIKKHGWLERHRITYPDKLRMDIACKVFPHYDFSFVYFPDPDTCAHECRDTNRHIYCWQSPYVHAIKRCDNYLGHLLNTLDHCAPNDYVIIIVADHGMTDGGRHSIAQWNDREVMQVPLAMMGRPIRAGWYEQQRYFTHDITSGIVGLFKGDADTTMFRHALKRS
ncbi:MAG: alkaline phosphatase family protein [Candidatus Hydrogenedentota bacterium]